MSIPCPIEKKLIQMEWLGEGKHPIDLRVGRSRSLLLKLDFLKNKICPFETKLIQKEGKLIFGSVGEKSRSLLLKLKFM